MAIHEVQIFALPIERFAPLIGPERAAVLARAAELACARLEGRTVWHVNSTATGGGVAEMLQPLLSYARGAGVDTRWLVISGDPEFFRITKRLHNRFHGARGDGGPLGSEERRHYEEVLARNAAEFTGMVEPGDLVVLHDPQTAGLVGHMLRAGAIVIWRCHVGTDHWNTEAYEAWNFVRPYVEAATVVVVSRASYAPRWLGPKLRVIAPSIDPFAVKNAEMKPETVHAILSHVGIIQNGASGPVTFHRRDGTPSRMDHYADIVRAGPAPDVKVPLVVQISRWDHLKDMAGVMQGFAGAQDSLGGAHLALVGPNVAGVADDPEGALVLNECISLWRSLPHAQRRRIQIVCLPMIDVEENAAIVNALQRHAAVVVQKSLAEGFGLTVAEAMWKSRPVVASDVGGIGDQIVHGESGLLLRDAHDLAGFGMLLAQVLSNPGLAARLGENARRRALDFLIGSRHLIDYARLFLDLTAGVEAAPTFEASEVEQASVY